MGTDGRTREREEAPSPPVPSPPHGGAAPAVRTRDLGRAELRMLMAHEARLQAGEGRELRDLGDGILLVDRRAPEPYWNRLVAVEWPDDPVAFGRAMDAAITVFATLGRLPHIWPYPSRNQPEDLVTRLWSAGFEVVGSDQVMVLDDPGPAAAVATAPLPPGVTVERFARLDAASLAAAPAIALVLAEAFDVDDERRASIEMETLGSLEGSALHVVLVRVDGEPAAVAKRSTLDAISYLSSIGTRPRFRRRGLGALVTAIATADAVAADSRWTWLKVDADNPAAQRLYARLGYARVPGQIDDLLLRR